MKIELQEARHFFRSAAVEQSAAIVDARAYYKAFYRAALKARHHLLLAGWQFDTEVMLLRGDDARDAPLPVTFLPFLEALCQRRPELVIYVLAWDYSFVYALEREWLQELKFATQTCDRLHFEFDRHPRYTASHHQKFVVVDGLLAFAGGMDICDERWDDRGHTPDDPLRQNAAGEPCRPNHEVQAVVVGQAAAVLGELFCARWQAAVGERLTLTAPEPGARPTFDLAELTDAAALPLSASKVLLSRTTSVDEAASAHEIRAAYEVALQAAERIIYIETQYFTSRSIAAALLTRLRAQGRSKLQIVVALPRGADSGKEQFALGEVENLVLGALEQTAHETGHALRFLCSTPGDGHGTTFIHSKVLVVDDEFLSIGSANMTERSMGLDSELALFWQAEGDPAISADIARIRASLLAEHAGREPSELLPVEGLIERVDGWILASSSRLRRCHFEAQPPNELKTLIFDPGGPMTLPNEEELSTADEDRERLSRGSIRLRRALARRSESDA